jgi:hypothetical protein
VKHEWQGQVLDLCDDTEEVEEDDRKIAAIPREEVRPRGEEDGRKIAARPRSELLVCIRHFFMSHVRSLGRAIDCCHGQDVLPLLRTERTRLTAPDVANVDSTYKCTKREKDSSDH